MRILVTGADGFIGSHLTKSLNQAGYEILSHTAACGDISCKDALNQFESIDYVFHLAARTYVPDSWDNTQDYFQTNIMGTITALEYCRKNGCSMTILSSYIYGEPQYLPIDENHPIVGMTPYHESKIACEELCEFYSRQFGVKITILRPFNVYGRGQSSSFLMPSIYHQVMDDSVKQISVMDLEPKRDYVYIDDVVKAMIATLRSKETFAIYNVGSGVSTSVEDVILNIFKVTGITKQYNSTQQKRVSEVSDCVADMSNIRDNLGFVPQYSLQDGLKAWSIEEEKQRS